MKFSRFSVHIFSFDLHVPARLSRTSQLLPRRLRFSRHRSPAGRCRVRRRRARCRRGRPHERRGAHGIPLHRSRLGDLYPRRRPHVEDSRGALRRRFRSLRRLHVLPAAEDDEGADRRPGCFARRPRPVLSRTRAGRCAIQPGNPDVGRGIARIGRNCCRIPRATTAICLPSSNFCHDRHYVANTQKYVMGPIALDSMASPVTADLVDFGASSEVTLAHYTTPSGEATLMLISYPTPQLAAEHLRRIEAAHQVAQPQAAFRRSTVRAHSSTNAPDRSSPSLPAESPTAMPNLCSAW